MTDDIATTPIPVDGPDPVTGLPKLPEGMFWIILEDKVQIATGEPHWGDWSSWSHARDVPNESETLDVETRYRLWYPFTRGTRVRGFRTREWLLGTIIKTQLSREKRSKGSYYPYGVEKVTRDNVYALCSDAIKRFNADIAYDARIKAEADRKHIEYGAYPPNKLTPAPSGVQVKMEKP